MRNASRLYPAAAVLLLLAACHDAAVVGPPDNEVQTSVFNSTNSSAPRLSVLNWNIYIGTNLDEVLLALATPDPDDDIPALLSGIETLQATDFPARAEAIANRIEKVRPLVVGLQEVWNVRVDLTGLGLPIDIDLDYLAILQAALEARQLKYDVAAVVANVTAEPLPGISAVDHDVILVDPGRVTVNSTLAQNYSTNVGPIAEGVSLIRGFVAVNASIRGKSYTFVNTHLEPDIGDLDFALLRAAQATELVTVIGAAERVVLMGDLNDVPGSPMHQVVTGAGFTDLWAALRPGDEGLTCCHAADLSNQVADFDQRIDYVLARGIGHPTAGVKGLIGRVGGLPEEKVSGPVYDIWPSDHAGLIARLFDPPAKAW